MNCTQPDEAGDFIIAVDPAPHSLGHQFAVHAATETGWMGGDSAIAIELAGHERLWLFSDTMLAGGRWVHNCIVVEDLARRGLRTVLGGTPSEPEALVPPLNSVGPDGLSRWLWAGHGIAIDDPAIPAAQHRAWVFFQEYRATAPDAVKGEWDFAWVRTILVELSLPDLRVLSRTPVNDETGVQWGAAVHRDGDQLLVYGVADEGEHKHLLLASTSATQPGRRWRYWTVDGWSPRPGEATRLLTGVSNEISVVPLPGPESGWLLVTSDTRREFGTWPIVAYRADSPGGPWSGPHMLLAPPENAGTRYAYNPTLLRLADDSFLLAYNVNSTYADVMADRSIYRPRFWRVRISARPPVET
ncbi:hypothetical protein NQK81_02310 [Amycolatopsis roodepoortensis]|uniref:hypothetical protein n=1 Tax=Amycolatopsis roodepoortensis TaxID=700274 RepID=UPI00214B8B45|nr:hypothetical protein [Amycolatopsis roodepoortensis]UUV32307.1 hypothetical protein NQK81_02310 [Amycolatopsis roodepoortensis]